MNLPTLRAALGERMDPPPRWWRSSPPSGFYALQALVDLAARYAELRQRSEALELCLLLEVMLLAGTTVPQLLRDHGLTRLAVRRLGAHGLYPDDPAWRLEPVPRAEQAGVVLHNDHHTTQEFVMEVLEDELSLPPDEAVQIMMDVHHEGHGVAGIFPLAEAQRRATAVMVRAARAEYPLRLTIEPR